MPVFIGLAGHPDIEALEIKQDIPGLCKVLTHEKNWEPRRKAALALGRLGDDRAVPSLIVALLHEHEDTRMLSAEALGEIGDPRAVEPLIEALRDHEEGVRVAVAKALGKLKDARALEPLHDALRDSFEEVRLAAEAALCNIDNEECEAPFFAKHGYKSKYEEE